MVRSVFGRALIVAVAVTCLLVTAVLSYAVLSDHRPPLERYYQAPSFKLTDRHDKAMDSSRLKGKVWIADFFFTRCKLVCPILSKRMEQVRDRLKDQHLLGRVQLVSVTVDPRHDTPRFLRAYAKKHHAGANWHFLTGDRSRIYPMIRKGFKLGVQATPKVKNALFQHSSRMTLVDQSGMIRGYYRGLQKKAVGKIVADARWLLNHPPR